MEIWVTLNFGTNLFGTGLFGDYFFVKFWLVQKCLQKFDGNRKLTYNLN